MEGIKTIKNVDAETWSAFKGLAARNNLKAAEMLKIMVEEYENKKTGIWVKITKQKPILDSKERAIFEKRVEESRKEQGWRI